MSKKLPAFLLFIFCTALKLQAQIALCSSVPISYDHNSVAFATAVPASFGDSMITFQITNNHPTQGFAYPLAKLVPLAPLPPGMALTPGSAGWNVFASSWNPGNTMTASIFYHVTMAIPADYMVTFQLWISNLTPVLPDSCYFDSTFTINLNPSLLSVINNEDGANWNIFRGASDHQLHIDFKESLNKDVNVFLYAAAGSKLCEEKINAGSVKKTLNISGVNPGIYLLLFEREDQIKIVKKVFIPGEF
jgi:type IX secretion system substrate protein